MIKHKISIAAIALSLFAGSCGSNENTPQPEAATPHEHADGHILVTQEKLRNGGVELGAISEQRIAQTMLLNGNIALHPEHTAQVSASSDGVVEQILVALNASVQKGQAVARVRKADLLDLQQQFLELNDRLPLLQSEYERYKGLQSADATAAKNLQRAESEWRSAQTTKQVLAAKLRQYQINPDQLRADNLSTALTLYAPVSGVVTAISSNVGAAVQLGTPICAIADLSQVHADFWVYEQDLGKIKNGQQASIRLSAGGQESTPAQVYAIDPVLDAEKRAARIHTRLSSRPAGLTVGAYAEAQVALADNSPAPAVPDAAIVREGEAEFIFVVEKESADGIEFTKVSVIRSGAANGFVAIRPQTPLPAGAKVVLKGAYYVSAEGAEIGDEH